jgi:hypothetical protein
VANQEMQHLLFGALAFIRDIAGLAMTSWLTFAMIVAVVLAAYGEVTRSRDE